MADSNETYHRLEAATAVAGKSQNIAVIVNIGKAQGGRHGISVISYKVWAGGKDQKRNAGYQ